MFKHRQLVYVIDNKWIKIFVDNEHAEDTLWLVRTTYGSHGVLLTHPGHPDIVVSVDESDIRPATDQETALAALAYL